MKKTTALLVMAALAVFATQASAEKREWEDEGHGKGHGHGKSHNREYQREERAVVEIQIGGYFGDRHRTAAYEYYERQGRAGHCPPGLAKKHNGCQPPGHAKQWQMGRPLERNVVVYPVPRDVIVRIGQPPAGYRYVQVLGDVLMVAIGTNMVVDAIEDLMR
jgi:Ni/Co efflux regulator RcnB